MKSILLVGDDPQLREAAYQALEASGYHVIESLDGSRARELLQLIRPSLLLVDLEAPGAAELSAWLAGRRRAFRMAGGGGGGGLDGGGADDRVHLAPAALDHLGSAAQALRSRRAAHAGGHADRVTSAQLASLR